MVVLQDSGSGMPYMCLVTHPVLFMCMIKCRVSQDAVHARHTACMQCLHLHASSLAPAYLILLLCKILMTFVHSLVQSHVEMALTSLTVHRLLITAVMVAAKLMDDKYYNNAFYAKIGGVSTSELNHMELEMLRMLDYRTFVSSSRVHELLGRLEVFQAPGRIVSVLCRKRASHLPDGSSAVPVDPYKHKPKLAKGYVAIHQAGDSLLPSTISGVSPQTISDPRCDSIQSATSQVGRCGASADSGVVCAELSQLLVPRVGVVDVSA